jgi:GntR family transcriptional regulator
VHFDINPSLPLPIYRQIVEQVRRLVAAGQLRAGDELPSVRKVAGEYSINPMTVSKAYSLLEAEGVLARERGMGMLVAASQPVAPRRERLSLLEPSLRAAARHARELEIPVDEALARFRRLLEKGD